MFVNHTSNTIPPSEEARHPLRAFLREGMSSSAQPSSELLRLAAQVVVQEMLEQEVTDFLGRERYERRAEGEGGYRNGYEPGRIRSAEGEIDVRVPQVRESDYPYRSKLMEFLRGNSCQITDESGSSEGLVHHGGWSTRRRNRSNLARPYIMRLITFKRLTCPSTWPLLHSKVSAARTAA